MVQMICFAHLQTQRRQYLHYLTCACSSEISSSTSLTFSCSTCAYASSSSSSSSDASIWNVIAILIRPSRHQGWCFASSSFSFSSPSPALSRSRLMRGRERRRCHRHFFPSLDLKLWNSAEICIATNFIQGLVMTLWHWDRQGWETLIQDIWQWKFN